MEEKSKVCVTGGSGYKGHIVHATLRNLDDTSKVGLLKSVPNAVGRLVLFQADIYNPCEFEPAIDCQFVFHVAIPMVPNTHSSQCTRIRLKLPCWVMASSPLNQDGTGFKSSLDESCWTPLDFSYNYGDEFTMGYTKSKTLAEKEILSYNDVENGKLEVVTLPCALVGAGGDTVLSYLPTSTNVILSQLTGKLYAFRALQLLQELLGSGPLVHVDDVCEVHIFCMDKPSLKGKFICAACDPTIREMVDYYRKSYPDLETSEEFLGVLDRGSICNNAKLMEDGFEYKYGMKMIIEDSVECARRLGVLSSCLSSP
ncbi:hypothetical protein RJ639_007532 [Escallonia herrerae]|uniref:Anthocyanidin reductase n=1 Tax=Escallonia herrerae TaxID=1293975 RepID=A0AA88VX96_9ASTE|nr:hypothetical protein RJ639_007532 [Escallonia herrerae]